MKAQPDLKKIKDMLQNSFHLKLPGADKVLNLGAADGNFIDKYPWENCQIVNVDNNSEGNVFKDYVKNCTRENVENVFSSCAELPFEDNTFDLVIFNHLIEHLTDKDVHKTMKEIKRVLKKNGCIQIATPNRKIRDWFGYQNANKYHKKEYYYDELVKIINKYFSIMLELGALWIDIEQSKTIVTKINDPKNSYVMWFLCKNDKE